MLQLGQFSAWITVEDKEVEVFDVKSNTNGTEITCWIPSTSNKEFAINWRREHLLTPMVGDVHLDGNFAGGRIMDLNNGLIHKKDSFNQTQTTYRRFVFADIAFTDDDSYLNKANSHIGEIRLDIYQASIIGESEITSLPRFPSTTKVHERTKKAFVHQIKLGKEQECSFRKYVDVARQRKLVTFIFKYRPLDRLKADGIAPRELIPAMQSQPKITGKRKYIDEDEEERRIKLLEEELEALRKKRRKRIHSLSRQQPRAESTSAKKSPRAEREALRKKRRKRIHSFSRQQPRVKAESTPTKFSSSTFKPFNNIFNFKHGSRNA